MIIRTQLLDQCPFPEVRTPFGHDSDVPTEGAQDLGVGPTNDDFAGIGNAAPAPSQRAAQICATEARVGIASTLGEAAKGSSPTWSAAHNVNSCDYLYPNGSFTLSMNPVSP